MQVEITVLTRRGGAIFRRPHRVTADPLRFGRGTENEVPLADIRVALQAAALYQRGNGLFIERFGDSPLRVNGASVETAAVRPGDKVLIGPYEIVLLEPPEGLDAAISVELVQPQGDMLQRLLAENTIGLENTRLSRRGMSWLLFLLLTVLCLGVPIAAYSLSRVAALSRPVPPAGAVALASLSWNPGELSNTHRFFAQDCVTCHRKPFTAVSDSTCLSCHGGVGSHVEAAAAVHLGALRHAVETLRCTACHIEHRGLAALVVRQQVLCVDCHRSLHETAPRIGVEDVRGFPKGHPQFRATLVADPTTDRLVQVTLGGTPKPVDHPGIKFSHAVHLKAGGYPALHMKQLACADCHVPDAGGKGFLPITYAKACERCHELTFDRLSADLPWAKAKVPHGDDSRIIAAVWDFYAGRALQGAMAQSPRADGFPRQAAGMPLMAAQPGPRNVQEWVAQKAGAALRGIIFEKNRGCAYCHFGTGPKGAFEAAKLVPQPLTGAAAEAVAPQRLVAPVLMRTRFFPSAQFDHAKHAPMACTDCHVGARLADTSGDVLIPGIQNCESCHGSQNASLKTQSTCTTCHVFHREEFGPMRKFGTMSRTSEIRD